MPGYDDPRLPVAVEELGAALSTTRLGARVYDPFPGGHSVLALAHAVLEPALPGRGHHVRADRHLRLAAKALAGATLHPSLYGGFAGIGWVDQHVGTVTDDERDAASPIDEALATWLDVTRWPGMYDLTDGLVGYGVYALERLPRPSASRLIAQIIEHLEATSMRTKEGRTWRSRAALLPRELRTRHSDGWDLGLAHGVPGVIAFLASTCLSGIERARAARLLDDAVAWLLAQELPLRSPSAFSVDTLAAPAPARSAWCYGDPGVAAALLLAAKASGEVPWRRAGTRVGLRAALRDPSTAGAVDASLCHGTAGLAHIYNRLYVTTEDERFHVAARAWLSRTLDLRDRAGGVAGYRSFHPGSNEGSGIWKRDTTFLSGTPGVALALASFLLDRADPQWASWDRVLLLSSRPASIVSVR